MERRKQRGTEGKKEMQNSRHGRQPHVYVLHYEDIKLSELYLLITITYIIVSLNLKIYSVHHSLCYPK